MELLSEHYYESKRQLEILKTQIESQRLDNEREVRDVKEKSRREISDMIIENQAL